jgi:O-antigen biosynthesis protein
VISPERDSAITMMAHQKKNGWIRQVRGLLSLTSERNVSKHFAAVIRLARRAAPALHTALDEPLISFVLMVRNTPADCLEEFFISFREQPAGSAELIVCDIGTNDLQTAAWLNAHACSLGVRIIRTPQGLDSGAAANTALQLTRGEWIGFADPDGALTPCVVQLIAQTVKQHPQCQFIYTDEIACDEKLRPVGYHLKPAYDEVMLSGFNYIGRLACYRRERLLSLGGLREGHEGAQEYDLLLRYLRDLPAHDIKHLPYPGYRQRLRARAPAATSAQADQAARYALCERYRGASPKIPVEQANAQALYRIRFDKTMKVWPRVSVIIPNRNSYSLISRVIFDLTNKTDYPDLEIVVVDNGTTDAKVLALYAKSGQGPRPFRSIIAHGRFNFSRQVNLGIAAASGELVLLLNNDIEVIHSDWLREMVSCFAYPETGIVGARLLYPGGRIQHAGAIIGLRGGLAAHWFRRRPESYPGPMGRLQIRQSLTAVTGACMLISKACIALTGNFDETQFPVAYNDMDFCLRAVAKGFRVVWTPFATLIHRESSTRGQDNRRPDKLLRLRRERENLRRRHGTDTFEDRAFSPWYSRNRLEPSLRLLDHLPKAR